MATILIIEDDLSIRDNVAQLLQFEGYNTLEAVDGVQGVELAIQALPDLIICNVIMPRKNGFDVASDIRAAQSTKLIRLVFLSGRAESASVRKGMIHADDYLVKPFNSEQLLKVIEAQLERAAAIAHAITQAKEEAIAQLYAIWLNHQRTKPD